MSQVVGNHRLGSAHIIQGNALNLPLPDASVDLICTSPPYFGLRSYQDGCPDCSDASKANTRGYMERYCPGCGKIPNRNVCPDCGLTTLRTEATKQALRKTDCATCGGTGKGHYEGQIGSEATPAEFLDALLAATREMVRVLKPSGSIFVNLGDKYAGSGPGDNDFAGQGARNGNRRSRPAAVPGIRPKSLMGIPWRYAIACIDQLGLILRAEIIWSKPNGLPESVTDRVRRSHEQWFHLTKSPRYFSAVDEIREEHARPDIQGKVQRGHDRRVGHGNNGFGFTEDFVRDYNPLGKLPGSVWTVPTQPLTVPPELGIDHFAAYPMEWPRRIIQGWTPNGVCVVCGEGRRPQVASVSLNMDRPQARRAQELADKAGLTEAHFDALLSVGVSDTGRGKATQTGTGKNTAEVYALADEARTVLGGYSREYLLRRPTGLAYACGCPTPDAPTTPAIVLDPFGGTGTTALVAKALGRTGITIDLSSDYCRLAEWRCNDPRELAAALEVEKPDAIPDGQLSLFDGA